MRRVRAKGEYAQRTLLSLRERRLPALRLGMALGLAPVLLASLAMLLPFAWMVLTSLRPPQDIFNFPARWIPSRLDLSSYAQALERVPFLRYLGNSLAVASLAVAVQLLLSSAAAYAFSRLRPRFGGFLLLLIMTTLMIPFESMVIPLYLQMRSFPLGAGPGLNLLNSYWALVLPACVSAFNVFVLKGFFDRLPEEIVATARIEGCPEWRIFLQFALPMSRPILAVLGVFGFFLVWNSFFWPLVALNDPALYTLILGIQKLLEIGEPWNIVMAAVTLTTVPTILIFWLFNRWMTRGMAFSGLQG